MSQITQKPVSPTSVQLVPETTGREAKTKALNCLFDAVIGSVNDSDTPINLDNKQLLLWIGIYLGDVTKVMTAIQEYGANPEECMSKRIENILKPFIN
jgi:hypothetical protein